MYDVQISKHLMAGEAEKPKERISFKVGDKVTVKSKTAGGQWCKGEVVEILNDGTIRVEYTRPDSNAQVRKRMTPQSPHLLPRIRPRWEEAPERELCGPVLRRI